jgi:hypothetical protein
MYGEHIAPYHSVGIQGVRAIEERSPQKLTQEAGFEPMESLARTI